MRHAVISWFQRFGRALWQMTVELAAFLPIIVCVQLLMPEQSLVYTLSYLYAASIVGFLVGQFRMRIYLEWLISLGAATAAVYGLHQGGLTSTIILFVLVTALMSRWIRIRKGDWDSLFPPSAQLAGVIAYLIYPIFVNVWVPLQEWNGLMYSAAVFTLVVFFFRLNGHQLTRANLNKSNQQGVPGVVARVNKIAVAAMIALLIIVANIGQIKEWLEALLRGFIAWLVDTFTSEAPPEQPMDTPQQPAMENMFPTEIQEKSAFWAQLEQIIVMVMTIAIFLAIAVGVIYLLVKVVIPALRRWMLDLNQERQEQGEFIDEMEKLESDSWRQRMRQAMDRFRQRAEHEPADAEGRVRFRYKQLLREAAKDGYSHADSDTPTEAGAKLAQAGWRLRPTELVIELYNRVRYRSGDIAETELDKLEELDRSWTQKRS